MKLLICFALICVVLVAAQGRGYRYGGNGNRRPGGRGRGSPGSWGRPSRNNTNDSWGTKLCANSTVAQSFLTQTQQVIANLRSNGSFTQALQNRANAIAYIGNQANGDLLSSNCTSFFSGLRNAKALDKKAVATAIRLDNTAQRLLSRVVKSLLGTNNG
ncbi:unnamed protein product [Rotaria socialis]|uniref:Uncharacterized protein n=1 Tax=Rotaria socialis TaxID=392032 RepID=A0A819W1Z9_9BILA|nr:unnamed protein product [Rotaria socialis]CAF3330160.1 unnamed protein product [Rotaria socialis]CAF4117856.1 unnamed protein product [Rotaria socialis]